MTGEFQEVRHSGGTITINVVTDAEGRHTYQESSSFSGPGPVVMVGIYALAQGVPVASVNLGGGIGGRHDPPPFAGCYMVMIASDSHGQFGHNCNTCGGYWRSGPLPNLCPYCRFKDKPFRFLSLAQRRYVVHYCQTLGNALRSNQDGAITIDMDAVADAAGKEGDKPAFYVSEESQQHKFNCVACNEYNDVIGRYAYCSACGTRNDAATFKKDITELRDRITGANTGGIVRDAISAFDSLVGQIAKQLHDRVPLSNRRAERLKRGRFHDLEETTEVLKWFDIDLLAGMAGEGEFLKRMFLRRHVYEHNGGEVDQVYLKESGDTRVRLKQHLSETVEDLHRLLGSLDRMARKLHDGFHELLPPIEAPIKAYEEELARQKKHQEGRG